MFAEKVDQYLAIRLFWIVVPEKFIIYQEKAHAIESDTQNG